MFVFLLYEESFYALMLNTHIVFNNAYIIIREMCYRTIKTLLKKPEDETKREPSPELAKISALVTRPPKQKSASKKTEEGTLDGSPALPTDTFSANLTSVPLATVPRAKKSLFKALPQRETPPSQFDPTPKLPPPLTQQQPPPYYFVSTFLYDNHILQIYKNVIFLSITFNYVFKYFRIFQIS